MQLPLTRRWRTRRTRLPVTLWRPSVTTTLMLMSAGETHTSTRTASNHDTLFTLQGSNHLHRHARSTRLPALPQTHTACWATASLGMCRSLTAPLLCSVHGGSHGVRWAYVAHHVPACEVALPGHIAAVNSIPSLQCRRTHNLDLQCVTVPPTVYLCCDCCRPQGL